MRHIAEQFRSLARHEKAMVVIVVFILAAIVAVAVSISITDNKNKIIAMERAGSNAERERAQAEQERSDIEQNRLEAERQAAVNQSQTESLRALKAELATKQVQGKLQKVSQQRTEEQHQYEQRLKEISTSTEDACQRWIRNCTNAKRLGLRAADQSCDCASR